MSDDARAVNLLPDWYTRYLEWRSDYELMAARIAFMQAIEGQMIENSEPDNKNLVPITMSEAYRMQDALERVNTLEDIGIHSTTKWRLAGHCRWHGEQAITLETNEVVPDNALMLCIDCTQVGRTRWVEISERKQVE